jgi:hypothetical protein
LGYKTVNWLSGFLLFPEKEAKSFVLLRRVNTNRSYDPRVSEMHERTEETKLRIIIDNWDVSVCSSKLYNLYKTCPSYYLNKDTIA